MTRFALVLVACAPCAALRGENPKQPERAPATELEGTWQEPAQPGEGAAGVRFKFTFTGDKVTVCVCDHTLTGTFTVEPKAEPPVLSIVCREAGKLTIVRGRYELTGDRLVLSVGPEESAVSPLAAAFRALILARAGADELLERGPVRLTLEKVKK